MSGLETAIRNALARSERANPEIRARIYQSARQALEAGLRKQDVTDIDTVSSQRQRLEATIRAIENEERVRLHVNVIPPDAETLRPPVQPQRPQPAPDGAVMPVKGEVRGERREGSLHEEPASRRNRPEGDLGDVRAGPADHLGVDSVDHEPVAVSATERSMDFKPERAAVRRKPRKFFSRLLIFCVLVAFIGMGAWWVRTSGLLLTATQRDTSVRNPPAHVQPEDYNGETEAAPAAGGAGLATIDPQASFSDEWIQIFTPADLAKVTSGIQAKAENVAENDGPAVRVTSQTSGPDGDASIEVPADVLQKLAGKASTVALTLQSASDAPMQVTIECDFQSLGGCGRHRFDVTRERSDALFQLRFGPSQGPAGPGRLIINSDVDGKAGGVNIYVVRILPGG